MVVFSQRSNKLSHCENELKEDGWKKSETPDSFKEITLSSVWNCLILNTIIMAARKLWEDLEGFHISYLGFQWTKQGTGLK